MKKITTSKGKFVVCEDNCDEYEALLYFFRYYKLSEITEEQASEIVDYRFECRNIGNYPPYKTALKKILRKNNIEITNNTYIFEL